MTDNNSLSLQEFRGWYDKRRKEIFEGLFALLRIPSISTLSAHKSDMVRTAQWLKEYLQGCGLEVQLWEGEGHPILFAQTKEKFSDRPTLLFYNHYDVQPVDPIALWQSDPFEPQIRENQIFARGAQDDKGQCFYVLSAIRAYLEMAKERRCNIKIVIEGEEESGSSFTEKMLSQKEEQLQADYFLPVDFGIPSENQPAITLGYRGILTMEVAVRNSSVDLHSGIHGGIVLNPIRALTAALAKMWGPTGEIAIEGFYDGLQELSMQERALLISSFDEERHRALFGVKVFSREKGYSIAECNTVRPSLEINGMEGGYTGEGFKTVLPATASCKISCRIVPGQDPQDLAQKIESFFRQQIPEGMELTVRSDHGAPAFRSSFDSAIVKIAKEAYEEVFGKSCSFQLCGATVPIVSHISELSHAQVAMIGLGVDSDNMHAPNEHFGVDRFEKGFFIIGRILALCSSFS